MSGNARDLTPRQRRAAVALAAGGTFEATAADVGVNVATLRRGRRCPVFGAAVETEARAVLDHHRAAVRSLLVDARERSRAAVRDAGNARGDELAVRLCGIRCNPITDSGASRSLIPIQADH